MKEVFLMWICLHINISFLFIELNGMHSIMKETWSSLCDKLLSNGGVETCKQIHYYKLWEVL